jgi:hypothetical protein
LSRLSSTPPYQDSIENRTALSRQAVELARRAGDQAALLDALAAQLWALLGPDHDEERLHAAADFSRLIERSGERERLLVVQEHRARSFLSYGDLAAADRETEVYERLAAELRQPSYLLFAKWYWAARALCDGRLGEGEKLIHESFAFGRRLQFPGATGMLLWHVFWLARQRDELDRFESVLLATVRAIGDLPGGAPAMPIDLPRGVDALVQRYTFEGPFVPAVALCIELAAGREAEVRTSFDALAGRDFADVPRDEWWMPTLSHLAEVGAALGDAPRCRALYRLLEPFAERNAAHPLLRTYSGALAHFLGVLAAASHRPEIAARHFDAALVGNAALGARPALARTQYEYGRLLRRRGRRADAQRAEEILGAALHTCEEIGLGGLGARVQQEILRTS